MIGGGMAARFVVASLASWRLTHLIAEEDGPFDVVVHARNAIGSRPLGDLADCFYCLSVWIAAPLSLTVVNRRRDAALMSLAISGAACLLERATVPATADSRTEE